MLGCLRPRQGLTLYQVQGVPLLLPGVPDAELETSQARLFDGSFASALYSCGNGHRKGYGQAAEDGQSSKGRVLLYLS